MTKLIFLEGIAGSGKSIVQEKLANYLTSKGKSVLKVSEKEMINTFLEKSINSKESCKKLLKVINKYLRLNYDYILFDRSHFTNISYFEDDFEKFEEIDNLLSKHNVKIIWLYYNPKSIIKRIRTAIKFRKGSGYEKYLKTITKGAKSLEEENKKIFDYYSERTKIRFKISRKSKLDVIKINVTKIIYKDDYDKILQKINTLI